MCVHGQACELLPNAIHPVCPSLDCPLPGPGLVLSVCPCVRPSLGGDPGMYIFHVRRAPPPALRNRRD